MPSYVLQPCKLRQDRLCATDAPTQTLSWRSLLDKFVPHRDRQEAQKLLALRVGSYIGLGPSKRGGKAAFVINVPDRSNSIRFLLKQSPHIGDAFEELYRVEEVLADASVFEPPSQFSPEPPPPARMGTPS